MKKMLTKWSILELYHFVDGEKVLGPHKLLSGDCTGLRGDCTGLSGNCTGLSGNIDDCEITNDEREARIDIAVLGEVRP